MNANEIRGPETKNLSVDCDDCNHFEHSRATWEPQHSSGAWEPLRKFLMAKVVTRSRILQ